ADLPLVEAARRHVPAQICTKRSVAQYRRNSTQLVPVGVDARHLHLDYLLDTGREVSWNAGRIDFVEERSPLVIENRIDEVLRHEDRLGNSRDAPREMHGFGGRI